MAARKARHVAKRFARDELRDLFEKSWAFEAGDLFGQELFYAVVLPAFTAERRLGIRRLELRKAAMRAVSTDLLRLPGLVLVGHVGPESSAPLGVGGLAASAEDGLLLAFRS